MKKLIDFFCAKCDKHLSCEEKHSGSAASCPRCGKEFTVPSKAEAEGEKLLREAMEGEDKKYAKWLKSRLKLIKSAEKKQRPPEDPETAIPPWLKKAAEGTKKSGEKNPLEGIDLVDMDGGEGEKKE